MSVRVTDRDRRLLQKLFAARWLTTRQIARLYFPNATADAVRKRLRLLADDGYLRPFQAHHMAEILHGLGPKRDSVIDASRMQGSEVERHPPRHLAHFVATNDLRVAVECGGVRVGYFFAAWELGQFGWANAVIPDAVFMIEKPRVTVAAEVDLGTEGSKELVRKLRTYGSGLDGYRIDAVLVVAETQARLKTVLRVANKEAGVRIVTALLGDLKSNTGIRDLLEGGASPLSSSSLGDTMASGP